MMAEKEFYCRETSVLRFKRGPFFKKKDQEWELNALLACLLVSPYKQKEDKRIRKGNLSLHAFFAFLSSFPLFPFVSFSFFILSHS